MGLPARPGAPTRATRGRHLAPPSALCRCLWAHLQARPPPSRTSRKALVLYGGWPGVHALLRPVLGPAVRLPGRRPRAPHAQDLLWRAVGAGRAGTAGTAGWQATLLERPALLPPPPACRTPCAPQVVVLSNILACHATTGYERCCLPECPPASGSRQRTPTPPPCPPTHPPKHTPTPGPLQHAGHQGLCGGGFQRSARAQPGTGACPPCWGCCAHRRVCLSRCSLQRPPCSDSPAPPHSWRASSAAARSASCALTWRQPTRYCQLPVLPPTQAAVASHPAQAGAMLRPPPPPLVTAPPRWWWWKARRRASVPPRSWRSTTLRRVRGGVGRRCPSLAHGGAPSHLRPQRVHLCRGQQGHSAKAGGVEAGGGGKRPACCCGGCPGRGGLARRACPAAAPARSCHPPAHPQAPHYITCRPAPAIPLPCCPSDCHVRSGPCESCRSQEQKRSNGKRSAR